MATQPPKRGGFQDPLHKWDALNRLHEVATTDVLEAVAEVNRIQEALSQPNLSHRERLALANTLIDAKSNLEKAKKASREVVSDLNSTRRLQQQINFRLGTLRSYLANNQNLNLEVTKSLSSTRQALEDLLEESQDLHRSVEKIDDVLKRVEDLDSTLKDLPEDLRDEMKRQTRILADIETQQRNAQDFLNEHEKRVRGMYENSMRWARSKVMSVADQVGFGALNLGNFLRAGGATLGGARSLYQGARYLGRLREARKIVSTSKREAQAKAESTSVNSQSGGVLRSIRDLVRRRGDPKATSPSTQESKPAPAPAPIQLTPPAADLPPAPELSPPQEPKSRKPKITTQPVDPSVEEERPSFGGSRFLAKTQGQSRDLVEQQEAILSEVKATRREIGQAARFDDQDREASRDQLDAQQELTSQVTKWVQYTQGYHRRLLSRLNKKDSTTEDGLFASLLKGGIGLVSRLIPGIGSAVAGLLGRSLIGRLGGRLISMIWGAARASLGLGGRVIAGAAGLLARAGAAAIAAGASWVTRGSKFILELGSKLIDRLSPGKKITEYGKRAVGLGRAAIGALGVSGTAAAGALIAAPAVGVAWSEQQNTAEGIATRIQDRKARISELEEVIKLEKEAGSRPQAYAKAEKELEQHRADLQGLEQKLQLKTQSGESSSQGPGTATATATPLPNSVSGSGGVPVPGTEPRSQDAPFVGTTGSKISDYASKLFEIRGQANTDNLDSGLQANAVAMAKEYYERTGKKIPINSGYRSIAEQARLYATKPKGYAAAPGKSIHNYGGAFDTDSVVANELKQMGLLKKYGFEQPLPHEKWHVQPMGLTLAAARAGVFSADAPKDQGYGAGTDAETAKVTVSGTAQRVTAPKDNTFTVAQATPISSGHSGGRPDQGGISVAAAVPSTQAITEPTPPALASQPDRARDTVGVNPQRLSTSMGANPQYGVRDIPTFDQSDSLFLALNLGVLGG
jgi:hypothetical protein